MKKSTLLIITSVVLGFAFTASSAMTTYSMWSVQNDTINAVSMGSVKVTLEEEFEQGQELMPGAVANKKVWAKNTGLLDIAVRAQVVLKWGTQGPGGGVIEDKALSTDNIEIEYNLTDWYYKAEDDFYYYKGVLKPGEVTTPLFERFTLNADSTGNTYKNKYANILVNVECVQAQGGGISFWDMRFEDLGITYHAPAPVNIVTKVDFMSPATGFIFPANQGDLFADFKLLAPGESRSQTVEVRNAWKDPVEIFLWAEVTAQHPTMRDSLDLVDELIKEMALLTITASGGQQLYRGAVWGNPDRETRDGSSMRYPYSLGMFQPGEIKTLQLNLTLDPRMDNRFKDLVGLINWHFSASGETDTPTTVPTTTTSRPTTTTSPDTTTTSPGTSTAIKPTEHIITLPGTTAGRATTMSPPPQPPPKTGNEKRVTFWGAMSTGTGAFLVVSLLTLKRQKKDERRV